MPKWLSGFALLALFIAFAPDAGACTCAMLSPCGLFQGNNAVFTGKVISIKVTDAANAQVLTVGYGQKLNNIDIRLPQPIPKPYSEPEDDASPPHDNGVLLMLGLPAAFATVAAAVLALKMRATTRKRTAGL